MEVWSEHIEALHGAKSVQNCSLLFSLSEGLAQHKPLSSVGQRSPAIRQWTDNRLWSMSFQNLSGRIQKKKKEKKGGGGG